MKLQIETMIRLLKRAYDMPHDKSSDVFVTAGLMAEGIEIDTDAKVSAGRPGRGKDLERRCTVLTLRELGLQYESVGECVYDLTENQKMTMKQAAARMGTTTIKAIKCLSNYKRRKLDKKK